MKIKKIVSEQLISVYILLAAAILYFIYSLGFMTNFYRLFYDGDNAMLEVLKELQLLNRFIFENALITLIMVILTFGLGIHLKKTGLFNSIFLAGFIAYEINCLGTFTRAIPYYINEYTRLDFSLIKNFNSSPFMLNLCYVFSIGILAVLLVTSLIYTYLLIKKIRMAKGVKAYE